MLSAVFCENVSQSCLPLMSALRARPVCGVLRQDLSGGYSCGVPPLPIPNREVKPARADGTAMQCGRVGRRLLLSGCPCSDNGARALFLYPYRHKPYALITKQSHYCLYKMWQMFLYYKGTCQAPRQQRFQRIKEQSS